MEESAEDVGFYSALNVFGLSLGVASGLILFLFISYHLSFDSYHQKDPGYTG